jgi:hypothetical protein
MWLFLRLIPPVRSLGQIAASVASSLLCSAVWSAVDARRTERQNPLSQGRSGAKLLWLGVANSLTNMLGEVITIAKTVFAALRTPIKAASHKARIWWFRLRTRRPPFEEVKTKEIAYSVLAGDILSAISYRNIDSPHIFIASLRRSSEADFDPRVYLLEQIGETYKVIWKSDFLCSTNQTTLEVQDIDSDGSREVIFQDHSYGTGGGSRSILVYSTSKSRLYSVTESLNWQNRAGPVSPEIEIKPEDVPEMVGVLESVAMSHGFLQPGRAVDFDSPEFSVERWHKENGTRTSGIVRRHYYQGYPPCKATVVATLDTGVVSWISFFKGPLVGYEKLNDRHFVAYSASWSYNWAKSLAFDGQSLWFSSHCKKGLMSFGLGDNRLEYYESFRGTALPEAEKLEFDNGVLVLNGTTRIPLDALKSKGHSLN